VAVTPTLEKVSLPTQVQVYDVTGLTADGSTKNSVTIAMGWTPTHCIVTPYGTVPGGASWDTTTLTSTNVDIYVSVSTGSTAGATKCKVFLW
jgi:hypothetical protein